jgi:hypothetical protein
MLEKLREFFRKPAGMAIAGVLAVLGLVWIVMTLRSFTTSEAAAAAASRMYIDEKTGKAFSVTIKEGMTKPVQAPSGGKTGWPAEECTWTKDGKVKEEPTYVLLNMYKGSSEPTFCPDCGRLVVGHNPPASPERRPPPTKEEYSKSRSRAER